MTPTSTQPDRLLQLRFGFEPERDDIFRVLSRASGLLSEREGACDVLVDATLVGKLDTALDIEFLSWIVMHYKQVRLFAIIVADVGCCEARVRKLDLVSGKSFVVFPAEGPAKDWLGSQPWSDDEA
jgi:hypothetical protein